MTIWGTLVNFLLPGWGAKSPSSSHSSHIGFSVASSPSPKSAHEFALITASSVQGSPASPPLDCPRTGDALDLSGDCPLPNSGCHSFEKNRNESQVSSVTNSLCNQVVSTVIEDEPCDDVPVEPQQKKRRVGDCNVAQVSGSASKVHIEASPDFLIQIINAFADPAIYSFCRAAVFMDLSVLLFAVNILRLDSLASSATFEVNRLNVYCALYLAIQFLEEQMLFSEAFIYWLFGVPDLRDGSCASDSWALKVRCFAKEKDRLFARLHGGIACDKDTSEAIERTLKDVLLTIPNGHGQWIFDETVFLRKRSQAVTTSLYRCRYMSTERLMEFCFVSKPGLQMTPPAIFRAKAVPGTA